MGERVGTLGEKGMSSTGVLEYDVCDCVSDCNGHRRVLGPVVSQCVSRDVLLLLYGNT